MTVFMTIKLNNDVEGDAEENDMNYAVIPRRSSERRDTSRRDSQPKLPLDGTVQELRQVDDNELVQPRISERRQKSRRTSKPKIIPYDEIDKLRK